MRSCLTLIRISIKKSNVCLFWSHLLIDSELVFLSTFVCPLVYRIPSDAADVLRLCVRIN